MEYRAIARYMDQTYCGHITDHDHKAVQSVLFNLPADRNQSNVVLIVYRVYRGNPEDISYVTTESKYNSDTRNP